MTGHLDAILEPRSIAVIGASRNPAAFGSLALANLLRAGYQGTLYAVHPTEAEIQKITCVPSVDDLPEAPDLCVIALRAELVPETAEACAARGVRAVTVVGTGFAESGTPTGVERQRRLVETARASGMLMLGPNTLGAACFGTRAVSAASANIPEELPCGRVGIVSQSGGLTTTILATAARYGLGIDAFVAVGNEAGVTAPDVVHAFVERGASAILCYIESIRDVPVFAAAAASASERGVPLIVLKGGIEPAGQVVTAAHTASLAGSTRVLDAAFVQWGVVRVTSIESLVATGVLFDRFGRPPGRRCGVFGVGGGNTALLADALSGAGIELANLADDTVADLRTLLPDSNATNPLDAGGWFLGQEDDVLGQALDRFADDDGVDVMLYGMAPLAPLRETVYVEGIAGNASRTTKPAICLSGHTPVTALRAERFEAAGVVELPCMSAATEALRTWFAPPITPRTPPARGVPSERYVVTPPLAPGERRVLLEDEAAHLLSSVGIDFAGPTVVDTPEQAADAASRLGFPVVVKALATGLTHRAQVGAVALGLTDATATVQAARQVVHNARAALGHEGPMRLLVQRQAPSGTEMIVGVQQDPVLGPVVLVGLGGVWSEVLDDVAIVVPPITAEAAEEAIGRLRAASQLRRLVDAGSFDLQSFASLVVDVGLAVEVLGDQVDAIDLNPVIVGSEGATLVDALVILRGRHDPR